MKHHNKADKIQTLLIWIVTVLYTIAALWVGSGVWLFFTGYFFGFAIFRTLTPSYDYWTKPWHRLVRMYSKECDRLRALLYLKEEHKHGSKQSK